MRCAILSDVHGNLDALEAVLADAGEVDQLWCLGDVVGYGPQPNECITLLRERGARCVVGNHDWAAIGKLDTSEFNPEASEAARWTGAQLTEEHRAYLEGLPERLLVGEDGEFTLVHGSPRNPIWEYVTDAGLASDNFDLFHTPYCLVGHTHVPLIFQKPSTDERGTAIRTFVPAERAPLELGPLRMIINPGSVGQPRDGNPRAAYMLYVTTGTAPARGRTLSLHRVPYAVEQVQEKMRQAGLPERLSVRLKYGW